MCKQVLVVDDDREILNMLGLIARTAGAHICLAGSGEEALAMLQSGHYRKLITDYVMPGMDGFTLAWLAKSRFPELEVVMMTGSLTDDLRQCAAAVGISRIVTKPLNSAIFLELL
jgi:CheY-like chemotaxis protein